MIPPTYKPKKKFMQIAIAPVTEATIQSVRSSLVLLGNGKWLSRLLATG